MKKIIVILTIIALTVTLCSCGYSGRKPHTDYIFLSFDKTSVDEYGSTDDYEHRVYYYVFTDGRVMRGEHIHEKGEPLIPTGAWGTMSDTELEEIEQIVDRQRDTISNNEIENGYVWTVEECGPGNSTISKYVGSISQNEDYMRILEILEGLAYIEED